MKFGDFKNNLKNDFLKVFPNFFTFFKKTIDFY